MINRLFKPVLERLPENNRLERIWVLAKTEFLKRYYGSFLGVVWALINPLFQIIIYYSVFTLVFASQQENFALFLFLGLILEIFFAETGSAGLDILKSKRHILENIKIKWLDVYYASTLSKLFALLFNIFVYFIISLFTTANYHVSAIFIVPLLIFNLMVLGFSFQVLLSTIQIYLRDIAHLWDMVKMTILWLSGIFYQIDLTEGSNTAILAYLTPLAGVIYNAREAMIYGAHINYQLFVFDWIYTLLILGVSLLVFSKFSGKALEKM